MSIEDLLRQLKREQSTITHRNFARIIEELINIGYGGRPERWHVDKKKVKECLPEKIEWFINNQQDVPTDALRAALSKGGVYI